MSYQLIKASAHDTGLPAKSVHCVVTSPPYFNLRSYSGAQTVQWPIVSYSPMAGLPEIVIPEMTCGLGEEATPDAFIGHLILVMREMWRILRTDGTAWINLGDSYARTGGTDRKVSPTATVGSTRHTLEQMGDRTSLAPEGLKSKDLMMIPARFALAAQADGWYLRSDIIWHKCLSGGTWLYVRSQKGDMPMMIKDMVRLNPNTLQLWDGQKWVRVVGWEENTRSGEEIEFVLRSGERICCTPEHKFPTSRGLLDAENIKLGDKLTRVRLPEPDKVKDSAHIGLDAAWFAGLYLAEGSRAGDCIQIAGHVKEIERLSRVTAIAQSYGGYVTHTIRGNNLNIRVYGKLINAIVNELVTGHKADDKGFSPHVWRYSNDFLRSLLDGYLAGDGHYDEGNGRWRLGFCRNYNLERDLRTLCARLDLKLTLNMATVPYKGSNRPTFRGEIRFDASGHSSEKSRNEVVEIRRSRCRKTYDISVDSEPHLFALASGILSHNSNPMPESVTDRCTKAHEYIYMLAKSEKYYFDAESIKEPAIYAGQKNTFGNKNAAARNVEKLTGNMADGVSYESPSGRNKRSVWKIATSPFSGAHFAVFPLELPLTCIKAGTSEHGVCPDCGAPYERVVERTAMVINKTERNQTRGTRTGTSGTMVSPASAITTGWQPTCICHGYFETVAAAPEYDEDGDETFDSAAKKTRRIYVPVGEQPEPISATVLDPFNGSGTTCRAAMQLNRSCIGIDISQTYLEDLAPKRMSNVQIEMSLN